MIRPVATDAYERLEVREYSSFQNSQLSLDRRDLIATIPTSEGRSITVRVQTERYAYNSRTGKLESSRITLTPYGGIVTTLVSSHRYFSNGQLARQRTRVNPGSMLVIQRFRPNGDVSVTRVNGRRVGQSPVQVDPATGLYSVT